ncbi:SDR family NAD(P)-dependent oxidoreductase [Streptomyces sp. NPDC057429]|uniref:SDR family NAD(P)-dependent oxidoreductase n=1 Tax=Streptomyces sp. NPDC057429 TaxID=3346130 RepID=UPI0036BD1C58
MTRQAGHQERGDDAQICTSTTASQPEPGTADLRGALHRLVSEICGIPQEQLDDARPLAEYGLTSRDAVGLAGHLEQMLDRSLSPTLLWEYPTIEQLVGALLTVSPSGTDPDADSSGEAAAPWHPNENAVAIVGIGCRLPGSVNGPDAFWEKLLAGTDLVGQVPEERWRSFAGAAPDVVALMEHTTRWGGFLDNIQGFDADYFGITPREAEAMDPQQRLLLEVTCEALDHAGMPAHALEGTATGVFVGLSALEYGHLTTSDPARLTPWTSTGAAGSIAANRVSYLLDLHGPSMTIDSACSSSLVAVHQACRSLRNHECDTALAAGVNVLLSPAVTASFEQADALAADGRCKPFDAAADGITRGEGCGVVALKRLADAQRDGDRVIAVIRGTAVNQDGRSAGIMAPNPAAQEALLRGALRDARIEAADLDYVETHGTGTLLGDPIEARALGAVVGRAREPGRPLLIGSVKSNMGHLEGAAGIVGLIKTALALHHRRIPASLHFQNPNPHIDFAELGLRVITAPTPWPVLGQHPGRAGVSAFGFGGTNAHAILEQVPATAPRSPVEPPAAGTEGNDSPHILVVSARSPARLADAAASLSRWLASGEAPALTDIAHTLARHRRGRSCGAVVARTPYDAAAKLASLARDETVPGVVSACTDAGAARSFTGRRPVFVFSGYGSQWRGMGQRLLTGDPLFAAQVSVLDPVFLAETDSSLTDLLTRYDRGWTVDRTQPLLFGMQLALARTLQAYGVEPAAVIGHSMGEVTAAVVAGALDAGDGLRVIARRSAHLATIDAEHAGAMAAVDLPARSRTEILSRFPGVEIAVHSSPQRCTVAGPARAVRDLVDELTEQGRMARLLEVGGAGHSAAVDPILTPLREALTPLRTCTPTTRWYSTVLEDPRARPEADASYWCANIREPVRLQQAVTAAAEDGFTVFVEISPRPIAAVPLSETLSAAPTGEQAVIIPTLHRNADEAVDVRTALTRLHFAGVEVNTGQLWPPGSRTALPTPAWRHERFWFARPASSTASGGHPLLGRRINDPRSGAVLWQGDLGTRRNALWRTVHGTQVLTLAAAAELMTEVGLAMWASTGMTSLSIDELKIHEWLAISSSTPLTTVWEPDSATRGTVTLHSQGADTTWRCYASASLSAEPEPDSDRHLDPEHSPVSVRHFAPDNAQQPHRPAYAHLLAAMLEVPTATDTEGTPPDGVHIAQITAQSVPLSVRSLRIPVPGVLDPSYDIRYSPAAGVGTTAPDAGWWNVTAQGTASIAEARAVEIRRIERSDVPKPLEAFTYDIRWERSTVPLPSGLRRVLLVSDEREPTAGGLMASLKSALKNQRVHVTLVAGQDSAAETAVCTWLRTASDGPSAVVLLPFQSERTDTRPLRTAAWLSRCLAGSPHQHPPRLWVATVLAQSTSPEEPGTPHLACLRGLVRVLALEHPHLRASLVDMDNQPGAVKDLVLELLADGAADEVAWRAGTRLTARLARADLSARRGGQVAFARPDGAYIITGGLTGLGLATACRLAGQGAGHLVLNGRRAPGPEAQNVLADLRARGTSVAVVQGDIADLDVATSLVQEARAGGHILRGVAHCAGVLHDRMITELEPADIDAVVRPKVIGALNLEAATAALDLDWWVTYSSAAALLGSPGQSVYAAANAWLDAMAHHRRAAGRPATSIAWGPWESVGGAPRNPALALEPLSQAEGMDALNALVTLGRAHTGVVHLDTDRVLAAFPSLSAIPFFTDLLQDGASTTDDWAGPTGISALGNSAADKVYARLVKRTAAVMGFGAHDLDEMAALTDLGLDSLMTVRIRNAAREDFGIDLPATLLLRGASVRELGDAVLEQLGLPPSTPDTDPAPAQPDAAESSPAESGAPALPRSIGPRDAAERLVASAWAEALHRPPSDIHEGFAAAGGDQRSAQTVVDVIRRRLGGHAQLNLTADAVVAHRTVAAVADLIRPVVNHTGQSALTTLRPARAGSKPAALFTFHPAGGPTSVYLPMTQLFPSDQPVYGLERVDALSTMEEKAAHYLSLIRDIQPEGPYHLLGWSFGGCLAYEAACQLHRAGQTVGSVGLIDTILPSALPEQESPQFLLDRFSRFAEYIEKTYGHRLDLPYEELAATPDEQQIDVVMRLVADAGLDMSPGILEHQRTSYIDARIGERYVPRPYDGHVVLYRAQQHQQLTTALDPRYLRQEADLGWGLLCRSLEMVPVEGDHLSVIDPPHIQTIARHVIRTLQLPDE